MMILRKYWKISSCIRKSWTSTRHHLHQLLSVSVGRRLSICTGYEYEGPRAHLAAAAGPLHHMSRRLR